MATAYLAHDPGHDRQVALEVLEAGLAGVWSRAVGSQSNGRRFESYPLGTQILRPFGSYEFEWRCSAASGIGGIPRRRARDTVFWPCAIAWHGATLDPALSTPPRAEFGGVESARYSGPRC